MPEKALSIQQPFAHLILTGRKRLENRTWSTPYRGRLWIHAAARVNDGCPAEIARTVPPVETLTRSAIIGCVQLIDCLPRKELPADLKYDPFAEGPICWVLSDPQWLEHPFPCKGNRFLWDLPTTANAETLRIANPPTPDGSKTSTAISTKPSPPPTARRRIWARMKFWGDCWR